MTARGGRDVAGSKWQGILDDYAASLAEQREFLLAVGRDEPLTVAAPDTFVPPPATSVPPRALIPLMQALWKETTELVALAATTLADLEASANHRGSPTAAPRRAPPPRESVMDQRL